MAQEHMAAAVFAYTAVTVIGCVVLTLPGVTFAILAGLLFGPVLGTLCCTVAATLGAMAAFLAGRFFLKDSIKPVVMKNKYLKKWLFDESGKNELFVLMITRLVPLFPYNLQNFAYGVTDIPFGTYSIYSFVFMLPGTAMYTVGTAGLADRENRVLYFSITAVLAAVVNLLLPGADLLIAWTILRSGAARIVNQPEKFGFIGLYFPQGKSAVCFDGQKTPH